MGPLLLLLTTFIWGTAFLAQKIGGEAIGPFAMTAYRNILGAFFLLGVIAFRKFSGKSSSDGLMRSSVIAGVFCGLPLAAAMATQQIGIGYTTPGISAFLTTNYVLFVPLLFAALTRQLPRWYVIVGAFLALCGTYFICLGGGEETVALGIGRGEAWTLLCALLFSVQMLVVDHFAKRCDLLVMSAVQLATAAVVTFPFVFTPEETALLGPGLLPPLKAIWPLVYCGVFSSGIAYTLQNYGQARTSAGLAAILLSLESVFGALSGYVVLGDRMSAVQFSGCALVLAAVIFTQTAKK